MPEISRFFGIVITMYVDEHRPPHIHIRYGGDEAVVSLVGDTVKIEGAIRRRTLGLVLDWVDLHRDEILANWERIERFEQPLPIAPLE